MHLEFPTAYGSCEIAPQVSCGQKAPQFLTTINNRLLHSKVNYAMFVTYRGSKCMFTGQTLVKRSLSLPMSLISN